MASLLGRAPDHVFSSLVLDNKGPDMPPSIPSGAVIEISDDEDDTVICLQSLPVRPASRHTNRAGPPSTLNIRPKPETSPLSRRDSKRQKLDVHDDNATRLPEASGPSTGHPPLAPNFFNDEDDDLFMHAYPDFFDDAFMPAPHYAASEASNETAAELLRKAAIRQARQPPYYHDPKLNLLMYRGPGHEAFPLPVDYDPKFQLACSVFDTHQGDEITEDAQEGSEPTLLQQECLARILDVFPDIQHDFVLEKLKSRHELISFPDEEIEMHPDSATIINEILEMDTYPKQKDSEGTLNDREFEDQLGKQIIWSQDHRQKVTYQDDAIALLSNEFDRVPEDFIRITVADKRTLFDSYIAIEATELNYFQQDRPYERSRIVRLHRPFKTPRDPLYHCNLVVELQAVKQHSLRKKLQSDRQQQVIEAEKANLEQHKINGLLVQCKCCFDDEVPMNRTVVCFAIEEHSFCYSCVQGLAESQIGMKRYEMKCMDESCCIMDLDPNGIGKAIPIKTFDRLQFNQQQAEIKAANIEGLEQCPLCDFQAICDPIEVDSQFACQNPDCFKVTCRRCYETSHLPKTCEEVKRDRGLSARHKVEEARTRAMIRTCPSCQSAIIKSDGCNKMRCTCGAAMCYVCKLDLGKEGDAYAHFNRGGSKCPLYDNKSVDRHVQEADEAEEKAIQEAKAVDGTIEESTLRIETGKAKIKATRQSPKRHARRGRRGPPVHMHAPIRYQEGLALEREFDHDFQARLNELVGMEAFHNRDRDFLRDARHMDWLRNVRNNYLTPLGAPVPNAGDQAIPARNIQNYGQYIPPLIAPFPQAVQNAPGIPNTTYQPPTLPAFNNMNFAPLDYGFMNALDNPAPESRFLQRPQSQNDEANPYNEAYIGTAQRIHEAREEQDRRRRDQLERRNIMRIQGREIPGALHRANVNPVAHSPSGITNLGVQHSTQNSFAAPYANRGFNNTNINAFGHTAAWPSPPGNANNVTGFQNRQMHPDTPAHRNRGIAVIPDQPQIHNRQAPTSWPEQAGTWRPDSSDPSAPLNPANEDEQSNAAAPCYHSTLTGGRRRPVRRHRVDMDALYALQ